MQYVAIKDRRLFAIIFIITFVILLDIEESSGLVIQLYDFVTSLTGILF